MEICGVVHTFLFTQLNVCDKFRHFFSSIYIHIYIHIVDYCALLFVVCRNLLFDVIFNSFNPWYSRTIHDSFIWQSNCRQKESSIDCKKLFVAFCEENHYLKQRRFMAKNYINQSWIKIIFLTLIASSKEITLNETSMRITSVHM